MGEIMKRPDTAISGWAHSQGREVSAVVNELLDWIAHLEAENGRLTKGLAVKNRTGILYRD